VDRGGFRIAGDRRQVARRAAWRGLAAASAATNILGKSLTARDRPHDKVPGARQLNRAPRTTSFPSGHAASAAAFATGVALEKPSLAAPVIIATDHVTVLTMALAQLPEHARPRPGDPGSPRVLARSDSAGATHLFAAACRKEGWSSPSGSRSMSASRPSWI
jgi:PAP2 superfamily